MRLTPSVTRELLARHGLSPAKRLGQHFLIDPNIVDRIVRAVGGGAGDPVVEIGAGLGTLTRALADAGYEVLAFEIDRRFEPVLAEVVGSDAEIRIEDAADLNLAAELDDRRWVMAANLPYSVGTPLLLDALRHAHQIDRFVVMLQAEVVDRLTAAPGHDAFGLPSVVVALHAVPVDRFGVPAQVFHPRPAVDSAVVVLDRRPAQPGSERAIELASRAFRMRRKMLRASLRDVIDEATFQAAGIASERRPEQLGAAEWLALAKAVA